MEDIMSKKRVILYCILALLAAGIVAVSLFIPIVHIVGKDTSSVVVYDKSVSLITYLVDSPFMLTEAFDIYFSASGPIWLATASILFNFLVAIGGFVMFVACIIELCSCKAENLAIKNNILAKKISLFVGWLVLILEIFAMVSFIVTTMMANGYVEFNLAFGLFILFGLALVAIVLAHLTGKRVSPQNPSKIKDSLGFAFSGLFAALGIAFLFIPQYSLDFGLGVTSFWDVARKASDIAADPYILHTYGDYPFGFATWVMIGMFAVAAFVFIYSLIGFCMALAGKKTNWLSSRVKRWSMTFLIVYTILYAFILCQLAVLWSTTVVIEAGVAHFLLAPYAYALMLVPYLPYIFSTMIAVNKKEKKQKEEAPAKEEVVAEDK